MKYIVIYLSDGLDLNTESFDTFEEARDWAQEQGNKNVIVEGKIEETNN